MYKALYRKWRPSTFDDVVGQEHITETLKNQVKSEKFSHAYLFVGTRGTGKTTCAKILSRAVNCENPIDGNPCNVCPSCAGILSGQIMDVEEMDAASNNGVDNVRSLREEAVFSPASVKKRVYIIDEVHMLSTSAFNALLKILEEPPEHLMFILATTELHKVPVTILSRCQRYSFRRIETRSIASRLTQIASGEGLNLSEKAAALLARLSDGAMRDAVSLLDQCASKSDIDEEDVLASMGLSGTSRTVELLEIISKADTALAVTHFKNMWQDGKEPATLLGELSALLRDILMCKIVPKSYSELVVGGYDNEILTGLSKKLSNESILNKLEILRASQAEMRNTQNPRLTVEMCLIRLTEPKLSGSISVLEQRISELEDKLASGNFTVNSVPKIIEKVEVKLEEELPWQIVEQSISSNDEDELSQLFAEDSEEIFVEEVQEPEIQVVEETFAQPEPEPQPEPENIEQSSTQSGELNPRLWIETLDLLKKMLPVGTYSMVCDSEHVEAVVSANGITLYLKNIFSMNMIKAPQTMEKIKEAAAKVSGEAVAVRFEEGAPENTNNKVKKVSNLDKLAKFGNVTME